MKSVLLLAVLVPAATILASFTVLSARAHDWFSNYSTGRFSHNSTGRFSEEFEACCGGTDCRTAEELGYPQMKRDTDGSYKVKIGKYWVHYDFPAVHPSEDSKTWICYMETGSDPEPLCLFLPPGII